MAGMSLAGFYSCDTIDLYEKVVSLPDHEWPSKHQPEFRFTIKDTTAAYQLHITLRHDDQYAYRNIWLNLYAQGPGDTIQKFTVEVPLATGENWLGSGMADLYEHRVALTLDPDKFNFRRAGDYTFRVEQIMRADPLMHVYNVGLRIEKQ